MAWALLAALCVALTMRLGFWQLSRAEQKSQMQQAIEQQAQLPPLSMAQLQSDPSAWSQTHRRVQLQGEWLNDKTVFLDNRAHHGRVGFWVMTPLRVQAGQVVWVQRGWVQRDRVDARKAPTIDTPSGMVTIQGRVAAPLSQMVELAAPEPTDHSRPRIQANLDRAQMQALVVDNVSGLMVQTGEASEGLRRDWPVVALSADKNKGYAFQWFALCALIAGLYLWFQWIQPLTYGKQKH